MSAILSTSSTGLRETYWGLNRTLIFKASEGFPYSFSIKTYIAYDTDSARKEADDQMRDMVLDFTAENIPIPTLYGLSALGTRICVYEYTVANRSLTPPRMSLIPTLLPTLRPRKDGFLISWNLRAKLGSKKLLAISKRWSPISTMIMALNVYYRVLVCV
ncbi:uncharacterized protein LACBIDRAFT_334858 [Laccaria bicolor S238N-H82]|uniref:Predicted protein n=1 Tax=Laccaria bicolor (strain S238N-H82 / ATCC MYA-4686) TaxID=486041 RepID=B0E0K4_LACBS|nr:uncharacterized protein LACBIDRAFT_334858 [Laccaria bicolor S238N-H82]EDQ99633.1 predicted protein [Laccaria bicolor S238N-H82]|eukprot:XP_001889744.1 predicted protein [Laccaria bicolor S238N-H82]